MEFHEQTSVKNVTIFLLPSRGIIHIFSGSAEVNTDRPGSKTAMTDSSPADCRPDKKISFKDPDL
jgi:hypothetical protein